MGRWMLPTALIGAVLLATPVPAAARDGNADKAAKLLEAADAARTGTGVKKDLRAALSLYKKADKAAADDPKLEHLTAPIGVGLAKTYAEGKKPKDAAKALAPVVRGMADEILNDRTYHHTTDQAKAWAATLKEGWTAFEAGKADAKLCAAVTQAAAGINTDNRLKHSLGPAAQYLAGKVYEQRREYDVALEIWMPVAEAYARQVAGAEKRRAELDAKRVKTPTNLPAGKAPPGELEGSYRKAVDGALAWLAKFQATDGSWSEEALAERNGGKALPAGRVQAEPTRRTTALAVMALIRAGVTPDHPQWGEALTKGLAWIREATAAGNGRAALATDREAVESQTEFVWTLALAVERLPAAKANQAALQQAVNWLQSAQNPGAGWRLGVRAGDNDSDHTAPGLIALLSARRAGAEVSQEAIDGAAAWLDQATDRVLGKTGYYRAGDNGAARMDNRLFKLTEIATAMTLCARALNGEDLQGGVAALGYDLLWGCAPGWIAEKDINVKYMKYFAMAYALRPGRDANAALQPVADLLVKHQEKGGAVDGSWPPVSVYAHQGRVIVTARAVIAICNARGVNLPKVPDPKEAK